MTNKQEIIRKDKNGSILEIGDEVEIELTSGGGTGVVTSYTFDPCKLDNSSRVWINWKTGHGKGTENIGLTCWSDFQRVTLIKRKPKAHLHAELIKAWADDPSGVVIQYRNPGCDWRNTYNNEPSWDVDTQYRIKPKTQKVKKYNFSYKNKFGGIQTTCQMFTEETFKEQFVDTGACQEFTRLDWTMQEQEVEV